MPEDRNHTAGRRGDDLAQRRCIACEEGGTPLGAEEIAGLLWHLDGWVSVGVADRRRERTDTVPDAGGQPDSPVASRAGSRVWKRLRAGWRRLAAGSPAEVVQMGVRNHHITKSWEFEDFAQGLAFVNACGAVAEAEGHHPDLFLKWGLVRVDVYTHSVDGLTESDFILAAKIDRLKR